MNRPSTITIAFIASLPSLLAGCPPDPPEDPEDPEVASALLVLLAEESMLHPEGVDVLLETIDSGQFDECLARLHMDLTQEGLEASNLCQSHVGTGEYVECEKWNEPRKWAAWMFDVSRRTSGDVGSWLATDTGRLTVVAREFMESIEPGLWDREMPSQIEAFHPITLHYLNCR